MYPNIILLSDLHCGAESLTGKSTLEMFDSIAWDIIRKVQNSGKKHIVLITGDIIDSTFQSNAFKNTTNIINRLNEEELIETFALPGNHDYLYMGCIEPIISNYIEEFTKLWDNTFFKDYDSGWPKHREIKSNDDGILLHLIGLNSLLGELEPKNYRHFEHGYLGKKQLNNLANILKKIKDNDDNSNQLQ